MYHVAVFSNVIWKFNQWKLDLGCGGLVQWVGTMCRNQSDIVLKLEHAWTGLIAQIDCSW